MVRNAGKFGKPKRGGMKQFSQNLGGSDGSGMWNDEPNHTQEDDSDSSEDSEESEDSGEGDLSSQLSSAAINASKNSGPSIAASRTERKAAKKKAAGKLTEKNPKSGSDSEDDLDLVNPNQLPKKTVKVSEISKVVNVPMNRKEREAAEKKAAQERYMKLHRAGKTDEAKGDLARLAKIRQQREQAAAYRKAEAEVKAQEVADKAALSGRRKKESSKTSAT
ncbi:hypothetical protein O181_001458 [Austropuccinia psidii MF-1]|uniref:Casein kinase substrate phosphoprotein PP28 domain-containing protein n=1 Tax=Austropuccinia psidii MF-1 TaxID=1389203 RepID=A0A9Q3BAT7_9BASI|nr:hypothetical protein [Austropuccinia psidii MF-1]